MRFVNMHKVLNESATYVIANYFFQSLDDFVRDFTGSEKIKSLNYKIDKSEVNIKTNGILPPGIVLPFVSYNIENKIGLVYSNFDKRLDMYTSKFSESKDILSNLLYCLMSLKITENLSVGINFKAECNTGKTRLSIFNTKINNDTISNWDSNKGFNVSIPMYLKDFGCIATYSVSKKQGGKDKNSVEIIDYIYIISVNYNFDLKIDNVDVKKRLEYVENLVNNTSKLYVDFCNKCKEITDLC